MSATPCPNCSRSSRVVAVSSMVCCSMAAATHLGIVNARHRPKDRGQCDRVIDVRRSVRILPRLAPMFLRRERESLVDEREVDELWRHLWPPPILGPQGSGGETAPARAVLSRKCAQAHA